MFLQRGRVAQLVEHGTENPGVGGSIPPPSTFFFLLSLCFLFLSQCTPSAQPPSERTSPVLTNVAAQAATVWQDTLDLDGDGCPDVLGIQQDSSSLSTIVVVLCPTLPARTVAIQLPSLCLDQFEVIPARQQPVLMVVERCGDHGWGSPVTAGFRIRAGNVDTVFAIDGLPVRAHLADTQQVVGLLRPWEFQLPEAEFLPELYVPLVLDTILILPPTSDPEILHRAADSLFYYLLQRYYQLRAAFQVADTAMLPAQALQLARAAATVLLSFARFGRMYQMEQFVRQEQPLWQRLPEESRTLLQLVQSEIAERWGSNREL